MTMIGPMIIVPGIQTLSALATPLVLSTQSYQTAPPIGEDQDDKHTIKFYNNIEGNP